MDTHILATDTHILPTDMHIPPLDKDILTTDVHILTMDARIPPTDTHIPPLDKYILTMDARIPPRKRHIPPTDAHILPLERNIPIMIFSPFASPAPFSSLFLLQMEEKETRTSRLEETVPEVRELLDHMEEDVLFRHKLLVYFYEYKKGQQSPGEEPSPPVPTGE